MKKDWYLKNKERHRKNCLSWAEKNPGRVLEIRKRYNASHREERRLSSKKYSLTPEGIYLSLGKRKRRELLITKDEFVLWYRAQEKKCFYCGIPAERMEEFPSFFVGSRNQRLSIDRLDNSKSYEKGNLALACRRCNGIKSDFFTAEEMIEIANKYIKSKWSSK